MHVHAHVSTGGGVSICSADIAGLAIVAPNQSKIQQFCRNC